MFPIPLTIIFEFGALVVSIGCYQKIKHTPLKWFIPYLFFLVVIELSAVYMVQVLKLHSTPLYNISIPIEYSFYAYLFYEHLQGPIIKKTAKLLVILIPTVCAANLLFGQGFKGFNSTNLLLSSTIVLLLCCAYFVDLFRRDEEISLLREPMFWITTGVLFFNLGELATNLFWQYLLQNTREEYSTLVRLINSSLIYVLYTFISIGILCIRKPYRKMSGRSFGQQLPYL